MTRVVLLGLRASGKSAVGGELALLLDVPYFDSDAEIARTTGLTPAAVIRLRGLEGFRRLECSAVAALAPAPAGVLALGGGAALALENRERLRDWQAVLLDGSNEVLERRMRRDPAGTRPPLTSLPPVEEIAALRRERWPAYLAWNPTLVMNEDRTAAETARAILQQLRQGSPGGWTRTT